MKKLILFTAVILFAASSFAQQYETVTVNFEKSYFGENEPLPAATYFMLSGQIKADIPYMEVDIYPGKGGENKQAIYSTSWKRELNSQEMDFNIPVNVNLRPGAEFDVFIKFYRDMSAEEKAKLQGRLFSTLDAYVDQSFGGNTKKITLSSNSRQIMQDLNNIVTDGMTYYRPRTSIAFAGFSDMVKSTIKQIEGMKLKDGGKLEAGSTNSTAESRISYRKNVIEDLKTMVKNEVKQYLNVRTYILVDDLRVNNYPTERMKSTIALNAGYGGAIFNFDGENFNYGSAPYLGIALPFGRGGVAKPFWSRTSISAGAFLQNFKDVDDKKVSGPIFKIPTYVGLGYRVYKFIKINASVAFLEDANDAGISGFKNKVEFRPMIGISAEFNFWVDLAK